MPDDLNSRLPASVTVTYPVAAHLGPDAPRVAYEVALASLALQGARGVTGYPGTVLVRSGAVAGPGTPPANDAELLALARQIATDWYGFAVAALDRAWAGVVAWEPEGITDWLEVRQTPDGRMLTRAYSDPPGQRADLYHFSSRGAADDAPPAVVKVAGGTPTAEGYYPGAVAVWDEAAADYLAVAGLPPVWLQQRGEASDGAEVYPALPQGVRGADGRTVYAARRGPALVKVTAATLTDGLYYPAVVGRWDPAAGAYRDTGASAWLRPLVEVGDVLTPAAGDIYLAGPQGRRPADGLPVYVALQEQDWRMSREPDPGASASGYAPSKSRLAYYFATAQKTTLDGWRTPSAPADGAVMLLANAGANKVVLPAASFVTPLGNGVSLNATGSSAALCQYDAQAGGWRVLLAGDPLCVMGLAGGADAAVTVANAPALKVDQASGLSVAATPGLAADAVTYALLALQAATQTHAGGVTTSAQTWAGVKIFAGGWVVGTGAATTTLAALSVPVMVMVSAGSHNGYLGNGVQAAGLAFSGGAWCGVEAEEGPGGERVLVTASTANNALVIDSTATAGGAIPQVRIGIRDQAGGSFRFGVTSADAFDGNFVGGVKVGGGSGELPLSRGGTGADLSATGGVGQVLLQTLAGAAVTVGPLAADYLTGTLDGGVW